MKTFFNFGCGQTFDESWSNFDMHAAPPHVKYCNILKPLPFNDNTAEVVYHSNVIEHLSRQSAVAFTAECYRILKPRGIIRIGAPDLEQIARQYLEALSFVERDKKSLTLQGHYDWALIELFDQIIREESGGEMSRAIISAHDELKDHIVRRIGLEAEPYFASNPRNLWDRIRGRNVKHLLSAFFTRAQTARRCVGLTCLRLIAGSEAAEGARAGIFRRGGEIHRWMYDRYSLSRMLESVGFVGVHPFSATESTIPGYAAFALDSINGKLRKPDSFYLEAMKRP